MRYGNAPTRLIIGAILMIVLSGTLTAQIKTKTKASVTELPLNTTLRSAVPYDGPEGAVARFYVTVPDDLHSLTLKISDSSQDLDILVYRAAELAHYSELTVFNERLYFSRVSDPPLETGQYQIEVRYQLDRPPLLQGRRLAEIPFSITATGVSLSPTRTLTPGDMVQGRLSPDHDMLATYRIDVPPGTAALRVDIADSDADVDLFLSRDKLEPHLFENDHYAQSVRSTETLVIEPSSYPGLRPGTYELLVIDQLSSDAPADFTLYVTGETTPPEALTDLPEIPTAETPLERAMVSTVELLTVNAGGSGTIVSPAGHILTGYHVITDDSGMPSEDITVGFNIDTRRPPAHLFRARYIAGNEERDIALLQINAGRYDQTLPGRVTFPFVELDLQSLPPIGNDLILLGYPWIGGTGSRVSITYTRGIVAGYQFSPYGTAIKTDGVIHDGNSGGAALNTDLELVAIPVAVVGADSAQLAYLYPIQEIPEQWVSVIEGAGGIINR